MSTPDLFDTEDTKAGQPPSNVKMKAITVDPRATSHITKDISKIKSFDKSFQPDAHSLELADETKCKGITQQRGTALVHLMHST